MSADPRFAPSSKNCTDATPRVAVALAVTEIVPETVAPDAGDVIDTATAGGVILFTVIETAELVALLFDVSVAIAVRLCLPLASVVVFKDAEYGAVVSAAPRFEPST